MLRCIAWSILLAGAVLANDSQSQRPPRVQEYDYIVVGGGTAGNAVATRLSQKLKTASILVIEAGPSALHDDAINVPGLKGSALGGRYDWNFTTVPQIHLKNRTIFTPRGRVLGGTSALNLLTWDRAAAAEYDSWEAVGNPGWNWRTMSAAMEKAETYVGGPPGSGTSGPIKAVDSRFVPAHQRTFVPAVASNFPIPFNPVSLQGNPIGVMEQPINVDPVPYNRSYSANAYLPLAGPNLSVLTDAQVARINLSRQPPAEPGNRDGAQPLFTATGVTLLDGTVLGARREVVLCAGAIGSPVLLELSGVGQPGVLRAAGVSPLVDLPGVGANYQDHLRVQVSYQLRDAFVAGDEINTNASFAAAEWAKRLRGEPGFYDDTGAAYVFADWARAARSPGDAAALVRLAHRVVHDRRARARGRADAGLRKQLDLLRDASVPQVEVIYSDGYTGVRGYPAAGSALHGKGFFTLIAGLMHPLSRGSVHIAAGDPLGQPPVIDPGFLDNEYDMAALVELLKLCRRIARAQPLRAGWVAEYEPGEALVQTDEDWREYVRNTTATVFHPMGTAAMLPREERGVVDPQLIVYGTANLRVADASIIPVQISAHPQTAVYGIAERAAEIIIAAHH